MCVQLSLATKFSLTQWRWKCLHKFFSLEQCAATIDRWVDSCFFLSLFPCWFIQNSKVESYFYFYIKFNIFFYYYLFFYFFYKLSFNIWLIWFIQNSKVESYFYFYIKFNIFFLLLFILFYFFINYLSIFGWFRVIYCNFFLLDF